MYYIISNKYDVSIKAKNWLMEFWKIEANKAKANSPFNIYFGQKPLNSIERSNVADFSKNLKIITNIRPNK